MDAAAVQRTDRVSVNDSAAFARNANMSARAVRTMWRARQRTTSEEEIANSVPRDVRGEEKRKPSCNQRIRKSHPLARGKRTAARRVRFKLSLE